MATTTGDSVGDTTSSVAVAASGGNSDNNKDNTSPPPSAAAAPAPAATGNKTTKKKTKKDRQYCDICQKHGGWKGLQLVTCKDCGVKVHDDCYALPPRFRNNDPPFICWACQAVGQTVHVREKDDNDGNHIAVTQTKRPTACCLCSVDDGEEVPHAMHPMYDAHGKKGRHIWLPATSTSTSNNEQRQLAWAHTLCALMVSSDASVSSCFGCTSTGFYGDPDDLEYTLLQEEAINSDLDVEEDCLDDNGESIGIHHFVYWGHLDMMWGNNNNNKMDEWRKALDKQKRDVKCTLCSNTDDHTKIALPNSGNCLVYESLRIPLQCNANNEDEYDEFFDTHEEETEPCFQGVHVGCAMWGRNEAGEQSMARRCWYFPGIENSSHPNPISHVYCNLHARDLFYGIGRGNMEEESSLPGPFFAPQKKALNRKRGRGRDEVYEDIDVNDDNDDDYDSTGVLRSGRPGKTVPLHMRKQEHDTSSEEEEEEDGVDSHRIVSDTPKATKAEIEKRQSAKEKDNNNSNNNNNNNNTGKEDDKKNGKEEPKKKEKKSTMGKNPAFANLLKRKMMGK